MNDKKTAVWARLGAFVALVAISGLALPLSAYAVEAVSSRAENWISVVYLALMAAVGAAGGAGFRSLRAPSGAARWAPLIWAGLGLLAAAVGAAVWLVLLAG